MRELRGSVWKVSTVVAWRVLARHLLYYRKCEDKLFLAVLMEMMLGELDLCLSCYSCCYGLLSGFVYEVLGKRTKSCPMLCLYDASLSNVPVFTHCQYRLAKYSLAG